MSLIDELLVEEDQKRMCGLRTEGGIYACCPTSTAGRPIGEFLLDPPIPVPDDFPISARGVTLIQDERGIYHVVDRIGLNNYPNVADMVEEIARLGVSRKLSPSVDFSLLSEESMIIFVHGRGYIENGQEYGERSHPCPHGKHEGNEPCAGYWWDDIEGGEEVAGRVVRRNTPSGAYEGRARPEGVEPQYRPAFVAKFPLHRLEVVRGGNADQNFEKVQAARLPSALVSS